MPIPDAEIRNPFSRTRFVLRKRGKPSYFPHQRACRSAKECGVHLFYTNYQMPVPIQIAINEHPSNQVIRVYDGADTMTDLRSGFIVSTDFSVWEHKVVLLAGLEK